MASGDMVSEKELNFYFDFLILVVYIVDIMVKLARVRKLNFIPAPDAPLMCPLAVAFNPVALNESSVNGE